MRKLLLALVLPFVFLLSQQGAVTHELSHLTDAVSRAAGGPGQPGHQPGDAQCEACLAYAHLAGVATDEVVARSFFPHPCPSLFPPSPTTPPRPRPRPRPRRRRSPGPSWPPPRAPRRPSSSTPCARSSTPRATGYRPTPAAASTTSARPTSTR